MESPPSNTVETPSGSAAFAFGKNWANFLSTLDEGRIEAAQDSLKSLLLVEDLKSRTFLDAGSGSGLFSLAAHRLGADVTSFDVDSDSVACAKELQRRYGQNSSAWTVLQGSLTNNSFLSTLDEFDVVYCWGVAHHTGSMWACIENLLPRIKPGGSFVIAIYNDQQYISRAWLAVKNIYRRLPRLIRPLFVAAIGTATFAKRFAVTLLASVLRLVTLRNPFVPFLNWARETQARGMHTWFDLVDWVGGWPFEVAKPEDIFRFARDRGFELKELITCPGHGCNEFVFLRKTDR